MRRAPGPLTRRSFLGGAAALPAFWNSGLAEETPPSVRYRRAPPPITSADQVVNVMDFEPLARAALPPAHFAYLATGVDDDRTLARNHEAFAHYEIRARRFADLRRVDTSRQIFGTSWATPVYLSSVSSERAFHPDGELAVARAAKSRATQFMFCTGSTTPLSACAAASGAPLWHQLYATDDWEVTRGLVRRAEAAGCSAIALTVDLRDYPRVNETLTRAIREDSRECTGCHVNNTHDMWRRGPVFAGLDVSRVTALAPPDLTVEFIDRLRQEVRTRLIIKGIVTGEDAALALAHGADGIVVSNHGGRDEETLRASIDCVAEVVTAVKGRIPVFVDGGFRRGTDVFKALALGATAVGIGRPQAWGLAAFGQSGVEAVLDILKRELAVIMRQAGTPTLADITSAHVLRSAP
ncbi:MAG: alpha-hydroxy-acid oxidizing protein [Gammaproteobacteria bacterium]|nr:alpha-hydroxy-acid oxidizing protein [Gammaproteobacteria bacterium]